MREIMGLALFCLVVTLASLGVLVWAVLQGTILSLDGLLLTTVCLLLAAIFGFCFVGLARDARLWDMLRNRGTTASQPDKTNPNK